MCPLQLFVTVTIKWQVCHSLHIYSRLRDVTIGHSGPHSTNGCSSFLDDMIDGGHLFQAINYTYDDTCININDVFSSSTILRIELSSHDILSLCLSLSVSLPTGIDLSKIFGEGGTTKILVRQGVAITDEIIGVSQLLGGIAWAAPKVYAYVSVCLSLMLTEWQLPRHWPPRQPLDPHLHF